MSQPVKSFFQLSIMIVNITIYTFYSILLFDSIKETNKKILICLEKKCNNPNIIKKQETNMII